MPRFQYALRTLLLATLLAATSMYYVINVWFEAKLRQQQEERLTLVMEQFKLQALEKWNSTGSYTLVPVPVVKRSPQRWTVYFNFYVEEAPALGGPKIKSKLAAIQVDCFRPTPFSVELELTVDDHDNGLSSHLTPYFNSMNWKYTIKRVKALPEPPDAARDLKRFGERE